MKKLPIAKTKLLNEEQIQEAVQRLAHEITSTFPEDDLILIGVLNGAFMFLSDLSRAIDRDIAIDFIQVSSYGQNLRSSGNIQIKKDISLPISGKNIIVVEDIIDSGHTMVFLKKYFSLKGAKNIYVCSLLDKEDRREVPLKIDFCGFKIPDLFVVGYGLDAMEQHRCLLYVTQIIEEKE